MRYGKALQAPQWILVVLLVCIALLVALSVGTRAMLSLSPGEIWRDLFRFFNLDRERNLPTAYAVLQLLLAAALAFRLFQVLRGGAEARGWLLLGVIFIGIAIDEWFVLHEQLSAPVRDRLGAGVPLFAWVIPYAVLVGVVGLMLLRFWWRQEPPFKLLLAVAGTLFVAGALGVELIGSHLYEQGRRYSLLYFFVATTEELLELCAIALAVFMLALRLQAVPHVAAPSGQ